MAFFPPNGIPTYSTLSVFPNTNADGATAIALDTDNFYIYNLATTAWLLVGGPGFALSLGALDGGVASVQGASIVSDALYMQSASASFPGLVNTGAQTFAGVKTFNSTIIGATNGNPPNARTISTTAPLAGGGDLSANRTLSITQSGVATDGYLSSTDWNTFNNKQSTLTIGNLTDAGTDGITVTGGTGAIIGSGTSLSQHVADTTHNGYLSSADWNTFNGKQSALTIGNLTDAGTDGITVTGGTGAVIGSGTSLSQHVADTTHNGYLSSTDWNTFNGKQASGNYITALTGDVTATGPGSVASTVAKIAGTTVSGTTGTTNVVFSNGGTLVAPVLGTPTSGNLSNCTSYPNVTQSVAGLVASAGQLLATNTNDDATSGNAGQLIGPISRVRSARTSLTTATPVNVCTTTSITLTAGDWDVRAFGSFLTGSTTTVSEFDLAISKTSATLPASDTIAVPTSGEVWVTAGFNSLVLGATDYGLEIPSYRVTVANGNTLPLYLVANANFGVSTCAVYGSMQARRIR